MTEASPATQAFKTRAFNGWALDAISRLDVEYPGTLRFALSASPFRRQAMFLVLSSIDWEHPEKLLAPLNGIAATDEPPTAPPLKAIAQSLISYRIRDLVNTLYGPTEGLVGALSRMGDTPFQVASYRNLVAIFSKPKHRERAKVLMQLQRITPANLTVAMGLQPPFILKDLVENLSVGGLHEFRSTVDLIRKLVPGTSAEELATSLRQAGERTSLETWSERWIAKATNFPVALGGMDSAEFVQLRSGEELRDAARRYRNCLKDKIVSAATGQSAYLECKSVKAIVELIALSEGRWLAEGIYGPRNMRLPPPAASMIFQRLHAAGALIPARYLGDDSSDPFDFQTDARPDLDEHLDLLGLENAA